MKEKDERDCDKCGERMEEIGIISDEGDYAPYLYQCPKCKTVKIMWQ